MGITRTRGKLLMSGVDSRAENEAGWALDAGGSITYLLRLLIGWLRLAALAGQFIEGINIPAGYTELTKTQDTFGGYYVLYSAAKKPADKVHRQL